MYRAIILGLSMVVSSCQAESSIDYSLHPWRLQDAIKDCPYKAPEGVSCEKLVNIANEINALSDELRSSPQAFGQSIMALQEKITSDKQALRKTNDPTLKDTISQDEYELAQRLAMVRWLESPEAVR